MDREKGTMVDASFICLCATCVKANFFRAPLLLSRFDKATGEEFFYVARYEEREEAWSTLQGHVSLKRTILAESGWANSLRGRKPVVKRYSSVIHLML